MSAAQQEQMPAEECAEMPLCVIVEETAEQQQAREQDKSDKSDKQSVAVLQAKIAQQQDSYRMLYARNLLLHDELTEENRTIARWLELPAPPPDTSLQM
jgi:negative regulator of replication initiation